MPRRRFKQKRGVDCLGCQFSPPINSSKRERFCSISSARPLDLFIILLIRVANLCCYRKSRGTGNAQIGHFREIFSFTARRCFISPALRLFHYQRSISTICNALLFAFFLPFLIGFAAVISFILFSFLSIQIQIQIFLLNFGS